MNPPQFTLKVIVFLHFILTVWATMNPFLGICYVYMNFLVLSMGLWSIAQHESSDSILMYFCCHLFSILQDIILLGMNEPRGYRNFERDDKSGADRNEYRFSLGMSIANLIIKPITAFLLFRIYRERGGNYSNFSIPGVNNLPGFGGPHHGGAYENIDTPRQPQPVQPNAPPQNYSDQEKPPLH